VVTPKAAKMPDMQGLYLEAVTGPALTFAPPAFFSAYSKNWPLPRSMVRGVLTETHAKAAGGNSRRSLVRREPILSSALLAAALSALLAAALLTATLLFPLALLTFTLLSFAILLLSALLSGRVGFAGFVWILLCVHDAFLIIELSVWVLRTQSETGPF
jgi:hypothetical protein